MEESGKNEKIKKIRSLKRMLDAPKYVGDAADVVPFAWAHPLIETPAKKVSKVYRSMTEADRLRAASLPARSEQKE